MSVNKSYSAIIIGATGLVGREILDLLLKDEAYQSVTVFGRRTVGINHPKLKEHLVEVGKPHSFPQLITGDHIYCAIGTTMKKAGGEEEFRNIDYWIPVKWAEEAHDTSLEKMMVVSSIGADAESSNFYLRTKGEMEKAVAQIIAPKKAFFFRPSFLKGKREETRPLERASIWLATLFSPLLLGPLKKMRPISARRVAQAMIAVAKTDLAKQVYESDEIYGLSKES